jgi:YD repeat-containing protein
MKRIVAVIGFVIMICWSPNYSSAGIVSYTYDSLNRLTNVDYGNGSVISYTYDAAGNRLTYVGAVSGDTSPPSISITVPTSDPSFTTSNAAIDLSGTAADNVGVSLITWANDRGGIGTATGTTFWTISGVHLQPGANAITVTAYDAAGNMGAATVAVTVTSTPTRVIAMSGNLAFGNVTVGNTAPAPLTIANTGNAPLTVSSINYPAGFSGAWSGTIPPGGSQPVTVTFAPSAATSYGGNVTVTADQTSGVNTIAASGTGTPVPTRIIGLSGNLAFGNVTVGNSEQATLTIANTGNTTLTVSGISYPAGFSGAWSGTIAAGGSQPVTVTFAPSAATSYGGNVTVNCDSTSGNNTLPLSGTGMAAVQCVTRDVSYWASRVIPPPSAGCATLSNVFNLLPNGLMNLGFLQVNLQGAVGIFWGNAGGTGDSLEGGDPLCVARKALSKQLIAAIANVTLLNANSSGCGAQDPATGGFVLIGTLISEAQAATQAEPPAFECSTLGAEQLWVAEMNSLTAQLTAFNTGGMSQPLPAGLSDCGVGPANARFIVWQQVDPTTLANCNCPVP